jgi:hypothetical protein
MGEDVTAAKEFFTVSNSEGLTFTLSPPERICPVCGPHRLGALCVMVEPYSGDYCIRCYAQWVREHIPMLEPSS